MLNDPAGADEVELEMELELDVLLVLVVLVRAEALVSPFRVGRQLPDTHDALPGSGTRGEAKRPCVISQQAVLRAPSHVHHGGGGAAVGPVRSVFFFTSSSCCCCCPPGTMSSSSSSSYSRSSYSSGSRVDGSCGTARRCSGSPAPLLPSSAAAQLEGAPAAAIRSPSRR